MERIGERQATLKTLGECRATHPRAPVGLLQLLQRFTSNQTRASLVVVCIGVQLLGCTGGQFLFLSSSEACGCGSESVSNRATFADQYVCIKYEYLRCMRTQVLFPYEFCAFLSCGNFVPTHRSCLVRISTKSWNLRRWWVPSFSSGTRNSQATP